jgi:hypothetical protein
MLDLTIAQSLGSDEEPDWWHLPQAIIFSDVVQVVDIKTVPRHGCQGEVR